MVQAERRAPCGEEGAARSPSRPLRSAGLRWARLRPALPCPALRGSGWVRARRLRLVTELLPVFAQPQLLSPQLPPAPCDQRARHWLPIIPAFAYSWRRGAGRRRDDGDGKGGREALTRGCLRARAPPHLSARPAPPRRGAPRPSPQGPPAPHGPPRPGPAPPPRGRELRGRGRGRPRPALTRAGPGRGAGPNRPPPPLSREGVRGAEQRCGCLRDRIQSTQKQHCQHES